MQKNAICSTIILSILVSICSCTPPPPEYRRISAKDYVDKMKAGWIGQMVGVGWGAPTEFKWLGKIMPLEKMPEWTPDMVNQHGQDDIYVEMTFLRTLEEHGFDVTIRQAGIDFANSEYRLWHANRFGRKNLRQWIAPPYSGHPKYTSHSDDIDYQIEADYSGLISPGAPQIGIELGEKFGRLMNYGDGVYGGQFVAGMYAEAFFETDVAKVIRAGMACIPEGSQYHECISDVVAWFAENPDNWQKTWQSVDDKYRKNPDYRKFSCSSLDSPFNIDAKINGAYIVMGLLYGRGDLDSTVIISTRCGQDSDCNPSNAAGVLSTMMGCSRLPDRFKSAIDNETKFSHTQYDFPGLIAVCEKLARQAVLRVGGRVEEDPDGEEVFVIPVVAPEPSVLEQSWEACPLPEDVNFTEEEMSRIAIKSRRPSDFVTVWQVAGPFSKEDADVASLFDLAFPPETDSAGTEWQDFPMAEDGYGSWTVDLSKFFGKQNCVAYLRTLVSSPTERAAILELGSDDGVKAWLNGRVVHAQNVFRSHEPGEDTVNVTLKQGRNELLLKITQDKHGWAASACFTDETAKVLKDLQYSLK